MPNKIPPPEEVLGKSNKIPPPSKVLGPPKKKESTSKDSHFYSKALKEVGLSDIDQPKKQKASVSSPSIDKKQAKVNEIRAKYPNLSSASRNDAERALALQVARLEGEIVNERGQLKKPNTELNTPAEVIPGEEKNRKDLYNGYPGNENKTYRLDVSTGKPVWMEKSHEAKNFDGSIKSIYYNSPITDPSRVAALNKQFGVKASASKDEEVFVGLPGRELNEYRVRDGEWQRRIPKATNWEPLHKKETIETLNNYFGKKVEYNPGKAKFSGVTEDIEKVNQDQLNSNLKLINSKVIGKEEDEVVPFLKNSFPDFKFIKSGLMVDEMKVIAPNDKTIMISLDNFTHGDDLQQSLVLQEFIRANSNKELVNAEDKMLKAETTLKEFNPQPVDIKIRLGEGEGDVQNLLNIEGSYGSTSQPDTDILTVTQKAKAARAEYFKKSKENFVDTKDRMKYAMRTGDKIDDKSAIAAYANLEMDKAVVDSSNNYMNDLSEAGKDLEKQYSDLNDYSESIKTKYENGEITLDELNNEYIPKIKELSDELESKRKNIQSSVGDIYTFNDQLREASAKNLIIKESTGSFGGGLAYNFSKGFTDVLRLGAGLMGADSENTKRAQEQFIRDVIGSGTTAEYMSSEDRSDLTKVLFSLSQTAGNIVGSGGLGGAAGKIGASKLGVSAAEFAPFYATSYYELKDQFDAPEFAGVSDGEKVLMSTLYGFAVGALEKFGVSKSLSKSPMGQNFTNMIIKNTFKDLPKDAGKEMIELAIENNIKKKLAATGVNTLGAMFTEFSTEATQEGFGVGLKEAYDAVKGNDYFNSGTAWDITGQILEAGYLGALGGGIMHTAPASVDLIKNAKSINNIDQLKLMEMTLADADMRSAIFTDIKSKVATGELSKAEGKEQISAIKQASGIFSKLPDNLSDEQKITSIGLLTERTLLEEKIQGKDEALVSAQKERINAINEELKTISQNATKENNIKQQEGTTEGSTVEYQGTDEGQQKVGQGEGSQREAEKQTADTSNSTVESEVTPAFKETNDANLYSQSLESARQEMKKAGKGDDLQVSPVSPDEAQKIIDDGGKIFISEDGKYGGYVKADGYMGGLFKDPNMKYKGVSKLLQDARVKEGGRFMEGYATYLEKEYVKNGFRPVARLKFNEEYAPEGWDAPNSSLRTKPDVVFFAYDPNGEYNIGDGQYFDDYDQAYEVAKNYGLETQAANASTIEQMLQSEEYADVDTKLLKAARLVSKALPNTKIYLHKTTDAYNSGIAKASGMTKEQVANEEGQSSGEYVNGEIHINLEIADATTMFHEAFHDIFSKKAFSSGAAIDMANGLRKIVSDKELIKRLDDFISNYESAEQSEEFLAELTGIISDAEVELTTTKLHAFKQLINKIAQKLGLPAIFSATASRQDVLDFINTMSRKLRTGEEIFDMITPGSYMDGGVIDRKKKISDAKIEGFDTTPTNDAENSGINMVYPEKTSIDNVLDQSGGAAVFINSDGTKVGKVTINGRELTLQGGIDYTFIEDNVKDNIGFAASEDAKISSLQSIAHQVMIERDTKFPEHKGKPVAVFVTAQNGETMLGEWYAGEYIMEGIDSAIEKGVYVGGLRKAKSDFKNAITQVSTGVSKEGKSDKIAKEKLLKMISDGMFDSHAGRLEIAKLLSSKEFSFGFRVNLNKGLISANEKSANAGIHRNIKKSLASVGHTLNDFWSKFMDGRMLSVVESTKLASDKGSAAANKTFSGFFYDPSESLQSQIDHAKLGIDHAQFNSSFKSSGNFLLDSAYDVNKILPTMGYPSQRGIDEYNSSNGTSLEKKSMSLVDKKNVSEWLIKNGKNKLVVNPYSSVALSIYTGGIIEDYKRKKRISPENSSNYANLTEDGKGNFVFYHVGGNNFETIKRGSGGTLATSKAEASAIGKVGGIAQYYTRPEDGESMVNGPSKYIVKVDQGKVYDFNTDPDNLFDQAKERFESEYPGSAFDANTQLAYVTKIANENGYDMVVADWNGKTRAQTTNEFAPDDVQVSDGNKIVKPFKEEYISNTAKGYESVIPESKISKLEKLFDKIYKVRNAEGKYDALYSIGQDYGKMSTEEISSLILNSDLSEDIKSEYNDIMSYQPGVRSSRKKRKAPTVEQQIAKAVRDSKMDFKNKQRSIASLVKDMQKSGKINAKQAAIIVERFAKLNVDNPVTVGRYLDYVNKLMNDADYDNKLKNARILKGKIRKLKNAQATVVAMGKKFTSIDPALIDDLESYMEVGEKVYNALKPTRTNGMNPSYRMATLIGEVNEYSDKVISDIEEKAKNELLETYKSLVDSGVINSEMTLKELQAEIKKMDENPEFKTDNEEEIRFINKEMFKSLSESISLDEFTDDQKKIIKEFMAMDLDKMDIRDGYAAIEAMDNLRLNGILDGVQAMVYTYKGVVNAEQLKSKVKTRDLKLYFSKFGGRFMANQTANLKVLADSIFIGVNSGGEVLSKMGINLFESGIAMASKIYRSEVDKYGAEFHKKRPNGESFHTSMNAYERGFYATLKRTVMGSEAEQKAEFKRKVGLIKESIETLKKGSKDEKKKAELYNKLYNKLGLDKAESILDVESKVDKINRDAVDRVIEMWSKYYPELSDVSLSVYNTILKSDLNYSPDKFSRLTRNVMTAEEAERLISKNGSFASAIGFTDTNKSGVLMESSKPNLTPGRYIDLDFDMNNFRSLKAALIDIQTAGPSRQIKSFLKSKDYNSMISSAEDMELFTRRVNNYVMRAKGKEMIDNDSWRDIERKLNVLSTFGTSKALGSIMQPFKQVVPVALNTMINAKTVDLNIIESMDKDFNEWYSNSGISTSNRGAEATSSIETADKYLDKIPDSAVGKFTEAAAKANEFWIKNFLAKPDVFIARASWLTYYKQSLKSQGIDTKNIDWSTHKKNEEAADFATHNVDRQQGVSDTAMAGELFASSSSLNKILKNTVFPYATFSMNQKQRMYSDLRTMVDKNSTIEDKKAARRSFAALTVEMITYQAIGWSIRYGIYKSIAEALTGVEPDDEDEERDWKFALQYTISNGVKDFLSIAPPLDGVTLLGFDALASGLQDAMDYGSMEANEAIKKLNEKRAQRGEDPMTKEEEQKFRDKHFDDNRWTFEDFDNGMLNLGTYTVLYQKSVEGYNLEEIIRTGKIVEKNDYGTKEKYLLPEDLKIIKGMAAMDAAFLMGFAPTDVHSVSKNIQKIVKRRALTEVQMNKYNEVKKEYGKVPDYALGIIKETRMEVPKIMEEIEWIKREGGLNKEQSVKYLNVLKKNGEVTPADLKKIKSGS